MAGPDPRGPCLVSADAAARATRLSGHNASALFLVSRVPYAPFGDLIFRGEGGGSQHKCDSTEPKWHQSFTRRTGAGHPHEAGSPALILDPAGCALDS